MTTIRASAILCLFGISFAFGQNPEARFTAMNPEQRRAFAKAEGTDESSQVIGLARQGFEAALACLN